MSSILQSESSGGGAAAAADDSVKVEETETEATIDAGLVRRFKSGDETAFDEMMRRHRTRIFHVVKGCLRDRADAEEVVSDTFIRAYRHLATFRGDAALATWLYYIAMNLARSRYRYRFRRRHIVSLLDAPASTDGPETWLESVPSAAPSPLEVLDRREFSGLLVACLERLPARPREILKLRAMREHSYESIAAQLGVRMGTVKTRLLRARRLLREKVWEAQTQVPPTSAAVWSNRTSAEVRGQKMH